MEGEKKEEKEKKRRTLFRPAVPSSKKREAKNETTTASALSFSTPQQKTGNEKAQLSNSMATKTSDWINSSFSSSSSPKKETKDFLSSPPTKPEREKNLQLGRSTPPKLQKKGSLSPVASPRKREKESTSFVKGKVKDDQMVPSSSLDSSSSSSSYCGKGLRLPDKKESEMVITSVISFGKSCDEEVLKQIYVRLLKGYLQTPRMLRGIETWTKLWFVVTPKSLDIFPHQDIEKPICKIPLKDLESVQLRNWTDSGDSSQSELRVIVLHLSHHRRFIFGKVTEIEAMKWVKELDPEKNEKNKIGERGEKSISLDRKSSNSSVSKKKKKRTNLGKEKGPISKLSDRSEFDEETHCNEHFFHDNEKFDPSAHQSRREVVLVSSESSDLITLQFPATTKIDQVSVAATSGLAVAVDGRAFVWGQQDLSSPVLGLGISGRHNQDQPIEITAPFGPGDRIVRACCGRLTSVLISSLGEIAIWGRVITRNGDDLLPVNAPTIFEPLGSKFVTDVVSFTNVCFAVVRVPGIDDVTEVWSWGVSTDGLLGLGETSKGMVAPQEITSLNHETIIDISVSDTHVLCLTKEGEVYGWGRNVYRQPQGDIEGILGIAGDTSEVILRPKKIPSFEKGTNRQFEALKVEAGTGFSLVLTKTANVVSWGNSGNRSLTGHPLSSLKQDGELAYLIEPTPVPSLCNIQDIHTDGTLSMAKTFSGALYVWGRNFSEFLNSKDEGYGPQFLPSFRIMKNGFVISSRCSYRRSLSVLRGSDFARLVDHEHEILVSASWHEMVGHLIALVERVREREQNSFFILDGLGNYCEASQPTSQLIRRMHARDVPPVFIVTDVGELMQSFQQKVLLNSQNLTWARQDNLMQFVYMFPSSALTGPSYGTAQLSITAEPARDYGFLDVFFLTHTHSMKLEPLGVFNFLRKEYRQLFKDTHNEPESWIPLSLPPSIRSLIQEELVRTRMTRILKALRVWLRVCPMDFLCSSNLMLELFEFLNGECESPLPHIHTAAIDVRRAFLFQLSSDGRFSSFSSSLSLGGNVTTGGSFILRYEPMVIAEQMTWIDANRILSQISTIELLNQRSVKSAERHSKLGCWVEKQVLECTTQSQRIRVIEALLDIMFCLQKLRNWFSFTALFGAFQQRAMRHVTGKVWETGYRLSTRSSEVLRELQVKCEILSSSPKYNAFFESLPMPKLPYLGNFFQKLIYVNERSKANNPPESLEEGEKGKSEEKEKEKEENKRWCYFEGARAEAELCLWMRDLLQRAGPEYNIQPSDRVISVLINAKGFRADSAMHKKIASQYSQNCKDVVVEEEDEENDLVNLNVEFEGQSDVELLLLTGRASMVTISDRMRSEVWGEWLVLLETDRIKKGERSDFLHKQKSLFFSSQNEIKREGSERNIERRKTFSSSSSMWRETRNKIEENFKGRERGRERGEERGERERRERERAERICEAFQWNVLEVSVFEEGTFSSFFCQSQALEATIAKTLESFPARPETVNILTDIFILVFGPLFGAPKFVRALEEMSNLEDLPEQLAVVAENIVFTAKDLQPILILTEKKFFAQMSDLKDTVLSLGNVVHASMNTISGNYAYDIESVEEMWAAYIGVSAIKDSLFKLNKLYKNTDQLEESFCVNQLRHCEQLVQKQIDMKKAQVLRQSQEQTNKLEDLLRMYSFQLDQVITSLNPSLPRRPSISPPFLSSSPPSPSSPPPLSPRRLQGISSRSSFSPSLSLSSYSPSSPPPSYSSSPPSPPSSPRRLHGTSSRASLSLTMPRNRSLLSLSSLHTLKEEKETEKEEKEIVSCDLCGVREAGKFCQICRDVSYFCDKCWEKFHRNAQRKAHIAFLLGDKGVERKRKRKKEKRREKREKGVAKKVDADELQKSFVNVTDQLNVVQSIVPPKQVFQQEECALSIYLNHLHTVFPMIKKRLEKIAELTTLYHGTHSKTKKLVRIVIEKISKTVSEDSPVDRSTMLSRLARLDEED